MKRTLSILAALLCVSLAHGQQQTQQTQRTERTTTTTRHQVTRVSTVIESKVMLQSESIGQVTDIVINDHGCIEYLVVHYGEEYIAVPWTVVQVNYQQHTVVIRNTQVTREKLKTLTFTKDRLPSLSDQRFVQNMRTVWGANAFRSESRTTGSAGAEGRSGQTQQQGTQGSGTQRKQQPDAQGSGT